MEDQDTTIRMEYKHSEKMLYVYLSSGICYLTFADFQAIAGRYPDGTGLRIIGADKDKTILKES